MAISTKTKTASKKSGILYKITQQMTIRLKGHCSQDKKSIKPSETKNMSQLYQLPWIPEPEEEVVDMAEQRVLRRNAVQAVTSSLQQCQGTESFAREGSSLDLYPVQPHVQTRSSRPSQATLQGRRPRSSHQVVPSHNTSSTATRRYSWSPAWSFEVQPLFAPPQSHHAQFSSPYDAAAQSLSSSVAYEETAPEPDSDTESDFGDDDKEEDEDEDDDEIYLAHPAWK
ncbi:hypothetical protein CMQ_7547 [Grosmannia clavigera kw1407]|uniref:Uncharacterized protein n=1 Tax=Grosmannia clavigera (strain kw1407 / UAMH 11150) TaxID=655863 RepID=F0XNQ4_GROCL|nr:uncharacterized protein CMQ_7547 [Grosmannia clavigera kw1407]EFX00545.1 hypothetical protein CMQ_7547 [Grosmannia clavigera kw1407]